MRLSSIEYVIINRVKDLGNAYSRFPNADIWSYNIDKILQ